MIDYVFVFALFKCGSTLVEFSDTPMVALHTIITGFDGVFL